MGKLVGRMELKTTLREKARYQEAAARSGLSLSDWARRRLDAIAEEELGRDDVPAEPTDEDVAVSVRSIGKLRGSGFGARVRKARGPWSA